MVTALRRRLTIMQIRHGVERKHICFWVQDHKHQTSSRVELLLIIFYKFRLSDCTNCGFLYWFVRKTVLLPQIFIAVLFPSYKAGRNSKPLVFVKPGSVVRSLWGLSCFCKKLPAAAPAGRAGPWRAPAVRWQHEPAVRPGPAAGKVGRGLPRRCSGVIIPAGLSLHLLGGLFRIHSTLGLPDAFGLELAHLSPRVWGFFWRFARCICGEPYRVPGDWEWCLVLYLSFSDRVAETLLLLPTKLISVPAS